jgi:4-hydroxythreonine-4-phosphate dehydrogenase
MQNSFDDKPIIGIHLGDASGCGPEIVAKLAASGRLSEACRPILIGDARVFAAAQGYTGVQVPVQIVESPAQARWDGAIPLLDLKNLDPASFALGVPSAVCGRAVGEGLLKAIELAMAGEIDGVLYAPIHKQALFMGGFAYESESEMFASVMKVTGYHCELNILQNLWTARVTSHVPLKDVSGLLTRENILEAVVFGDATLKQAGIARPRIAVAALNPHAGENGKCGREEIEVISPAIAAAQAQGVDAKGPFPADTVFTRAFKGEFDMIVTLYHDQGQIALKTKGFSEGVTVPGGMPVPIATPAHGTAYGKVGKGTADVSATANALAVVCRMGVQRRRNRAA